MHTCPYNEVFSWPVYTHAYPYKLRVENSSRQTVLSCAERFVFPVALTFTEKGMLLPTGGNLGRRSEKYQRLPLNNGESIGLEEF